MLAAAAAAHTAAAAAATRHQPCEMRETGGPQGVGVFALVPIPKDMIICNYKNYATIMDAKGYKASITNYRIKRYKTQRWSKVCKVLCCCLHCLCLSADVRCAADRQILL